MNRKNCSCLITLFIGIILGIIVGYNAYLAVIPGIVTALWIAFGIGIGALILLAIMAQARCERREKCICKNGTCIAIPAVGTIITAIIGLSITITTGSIGIAILIGLATLFLIMTILNILDYILCLINEKCECR